MKAKDRPTKFGLDPYFYPLKVSMPQTNWRIGYYLSDHWLISLGQDHMKYVMQNDELVDINGNIDLNGVWDGVYANESIVLHQDFYCLSLPMGLTISMSKSDVLIQICLSTFWTLHLASFKALGWVFYIRRPILR
ncbi:MAG: hypothetical protein CBB92_05220 [Flammeovirgaceae bacterium TMED32]|nr:MAG: hypothetical protein CBB92_05220 [Flammeovirgaceae bacterium TMED32]